jgi:hypothetical protein
VSHINDNILDNKRTGQIVWRPEITDGEIWMAQGQQAEYGFAQKQINLGLIAIFAVY